MATEDEPGGPAAARSPIEEEVDHDQKPDVELITEKGGSEYSNLGEAGADLSGDVDDINDTDGAGIRSDEDYIRDTDDAGSGDGNEQESRRQYHLRVLAELDEFLPEDTTEESIIPPDLRQALPPSVHSLLSRLESPAADDPVRELKPKDLQSPGFGALGFISVFSYKTHREYLEYREFEEKFGQMSGERVAAVRLLIITAIGNCQTLEAIDFSEMELTLQELKALLVPLQTSPVLRELKLYLRGMNAKPTCKLVVDFLKGKQNLRVLSIDDSYDRYDEGLYFIRSHLAIHGHPTVEVLCLSSLQFSGGHFKWWEDELDKMSIIRACPNLQQMPSAPWSIEDPEEYKIAKMYRQLLGDHHSFRNLEVEGESGILATFLLGLCTEPCLITSLTSLAIEVRGWKRVKGKMLTLQLSGALEWQAMFRSLKQNNILRSLSFSLDLRDRGDLRDGRWKPEWKAVWEEFIAVVERNSKLDSLNISRFPGLNLSLLLDVIRSHKGLSSLGLEHFELSPDDSIALASFVEKNTVITALTLRSSRFASMKEVFSSLRSNVKLTKLRLNRTSSLTDVDLAELLSTLQVNPTLTEIDLWGSNWWREGKVEVVEYALQETERQNTPSYGFISPSTRDKPQVLIALQRNPRLRRFFLSLQTPKAGGGFAPADWKLLESFFRESGTVESLTVFGADNQEDEQSISNLWGVIISSKSLRSLTVRDLDFLGYSEPLQRLVRENKLLTGLDFTRVRGVDWQKFFQSLRYSEGLEYLKLRLNKYLEDGAFKELLSAVQVNSSLKHITVSNLGAEGAAILEEVLQQKGRRENYMAEIKRTLGVEESDEFNPDTARIFLCGSPCAGKTELRVALTKVVAQRSKTPGFWTSCFPQIKDLRRTQGIEIELLDLGTLQVSVWDLAGQDIFRALQDILFPKLRLACLFVFVFSPFDNEGNRLKPGLNEKLRGEFRPWLRFIASNSQISNYVLPQVKVVISHKDKLELGEVQNIGWAEYIISELRDEFEELLEIDPRVFYTNSKLPGKDTEEILDSLRESLKDILKEKLFPIPSSCRALDSALCKRSIFWNPVYEIPGLIHKLMLCGNRLKPKQEIQPILSTSEFFELCQQEVPSLGRIDCATAEGQGFVKSLAEYLHDAGTIIYFGRSSQLDLIIMNPNWFTFSFMGRLIGTGHGFQESRIHVNQFSNRRDGLVSQADFDQLLTRFSQTLRKEGFNVPKVEILQGIMEEMDLYFHVVDGSANYYFAPAIFVEEQDKRSSEGLRKLPGWKLTYKDSDCSSSPRYMGVRLQCQDQRRTMLTPAFFPRFQVHFRKVLISNKGLRANQIRCDYNMMHILYGKHEIYIENDGASGDHIDVLVRSWNPHSETFKFVDQHVVKELRAFCASTKGCSGVILVEGVLRSDCVEKLTLSAHRDTQTVLIEELKSLWKEDLKRCWQEDVDILRRWEDDNSMIKKLTNYHYLWPSKEEAGLPESSESVKDLLPGEDYMDVLSKIEDTLEPLQRQADILKSVTEEIAHAVRDKGAEEGANDGEIRVKASTPQHFKVSRSSTRFQSSKLSRNKSDVMTTNQRMVLGFDDLCQEVSGLSQEVKGMSENFKEVNIILRQVHTEVRNLRYSVMEMMASVNHQLDQLTGLTADICAGMSKVPSRPYLTSGDPSLGHRITATMNIGEARVLHFMCEEAGGNHLVADQPGYPITVLRENVEKLRCLSVNSIKVLWYLLKAGVTITIGLDIPDLYTGEEITTVTVESLGNVLSNLESVVVQGKRVSSTNNSGKSDTDREAWQYLKQLFTADLKDQCTKYFLLYRVRYIGPGTSATSSHASWLCKQCIDKGKRMGTVVQVD